MLSLSTLVLLWVCLEIQGKQWGMQAGERRQIDGEREKHSYNILHVVGGREAERDM